MLVAVVLLILGLILLAYGADRLVFSASILCRTLGIPPLIIGMTVVGIGTSLPEIILSLSAAQHGQRDFSVGIALGSNITNILLILGGAALLHPLKINSALLRRELPLMLLVALLCGPLLMDNHLSRVGGGCLLAIAALYLCGIIWMAKTNREATVDTLTREQLAELPGEDAGNTVACLWLGVALILLPVATGMILDNATVVADYFGISDLMMSLLFLSIGTSLPELATVIAGTLKGEGDIAVGNLLGANIYNTSIVLGLPALVSPGEIDSNAFNRDYWVMLGISTLFTVICLKRNRRIGRITGALLLCGFLAWVAILWGYPMISDQ
ncbi:calcium/sodium antiporter [Tatumella saanichensis]|uniref:calcium/sodium antiporter n=1 Tax=Tatumella saanichensis TaxID=480813 RepID=UPI0004A4893C|nr:calcium/sodium antiporter [Tatumella saanichensis]